MKEFIEKLIARLEEEKVDIGGRTGFSKGINKSIEIVNQLAEEYNNSNDSMEIQIAKNYVKWLTKCGVNVTEKWLTATEQAYALNEAYMRGRQDERDRFAEWQEEHNNGWIPCTVVEHPEHCNDCEVTFKDVRGYGRGVAFYTDKWRRASDEVPILVVAWKEPSAPYQPEGE